MPVRQWTSRQVVNWQMSHYAEMNWLTIWQFVTLYWIDLISVVDETIIRQHWSAECFWSQTWSTWEVHFKCALRFRNIHKHSVLQCCLSTGTGCSVVYVETAMTVRQWTSRQVVNWQMSHYAEINWLTIWQLSHYTELILLVLLMK